jgi:hypothetical protein
VAITDELLAAVKGFCGWRQYLEQRGGIQEYIASLVMVLPPATDAHQVGIRIEAFTSVRSVRPTEDFGVLAEHLTATAPQLEDENGRQIDADAAMVFTLARHGVDQTVEVFMALRGGALECQIFRHCKPGRRQDGMGTHDDLRSDRSTTGGTQQDSDRHGTRARQSV